MQGAIRPFPKFVGRWIYCFFRESRSYTGDRLGEDIQLGRAPFNSLAAN